MTLDLIKRFEREWEVAGLNNLDAILSPAKLEPRNFIILSKGLNVGQIQMVKDFPVEILGMN